MREYITDVLDNIKKDASIDDIKIACRGIVDKSDLANCDIIQPYTEEERNSIADGMYDFIINPSIQDIREIIFSKNRSLDRSLVGSSIEYFEFASMFSLEFLAQYCWLEWSDFGDLEGAPFRLVEYFAAILFRYTWCYHQDMAVFPVSHVVHFSMLASNLSTVLGIKASAQEISYKLIIALKQQED